MGLGRDGAGGDGGLDVRIDLVMDGLTGHADSVHDSQGRAGAVADDDDALDP